MHSNHTPNPIITMKKTLFLTIFTLLLIGCSATKKSTNSNSSISNTHLKENSTTNYTTEEIYIDYVYEGEMPEFPGRIAECMKFIKKNMQYPEEAIKKGIEGQVICQFTVTKDGSIEDIIVVRGLHKSLDKEAVRVIKKMPKWKPGKNYKGQVQDCKYTIPVTFKLPK